jgi:phosphoenolpyruvate phosphomutase
MHFLLEAHNGLGARIVEEAGFEGIWASGLTLAAQFGVRDSNEASWTQILEMLEFMSDATHIPILLDGDTGYGNFNNVRRLVQKLEQRGVAGVCIEDKLFPKTNSFLQPGRQPLADIDEFAGKIRAGKDSQHDPDFVIVARIEAFIAGRGLDEALRRAEAYHRAGADGILIHSALSVPTEVLAFKHAWGDRCPVLIVPTKYYTTPTEVFRESGFAVVIWANHLLRAVITAMQQTARTIRCEQNLLTAEARIAPVAEVFRLQGADELEAAEQRYLPRSTRGVRAVVLAAARGHELGPLTEDRPKALVAVGGKPLLKHVLDAYHAVGIKDVSVVRGYKKERVDLPGARYVDNDEHATTGELVSLQKALEALAEPAETIISYGDVLFNKYIPQILAEEDDDLVVALDTNWRESANRHREADYAQCSLAGGRQVFFQKAYLRRIAPDLPEDAIHGEWMGFLKVSARALPMVKEVLDRLVASPAGRLRKMPLLLNELVCLDHPVRVLYTSGHWLDVDSLEDIGQARIFS